MDPIKKKRLEADGWTVGSIEDLLGLSPLQLAYVDLTIHLAEQIKKIRIEKDLTQSALASLMGSSQSRVAKLERGDPSVSFDLMLRAFIHLGVSPKTLGLLILYYEDPTRLDLIDWSSWPEEKVYEMDLSSEDILRHSEQSGEVSPSSRFLLHKETLDRGKEMHSPKFIKERDSENEELEGSPNQDSEA